MTFNRQRSSFLSVLVILVSISGIGLASVAQTKPAQGCGANLLINPSFDTPAVPSSWRPVSETAMPGWQADPGTAIEVWASGFLGFASNSGPNLVELNYQGITLVFQDIPTTPGDELVWASHHRSRSLGDTFEVLIGAPGDLQQMATAEAPTNSWLPVGGTYVVPSGQTVTRFGLRGVSSGAAGNLVDDASVSVSCTPKEPVVAVDDAFLAADLAGPLDIGANDVLLPGYAYTTAPIAPPLLGTAAISEDGYADYVPNGGASGIDAFTYEVCLEDELGRQCSAATATINLDG